MPEKSKPERAPSLYGLCEPNTKISVFRLNKMEAGIILQYRYLKVLRQ